MDLIVTATAQGLLWGMMALGIFITYRILDLPDMTAEGSFPLGAAVCAQLIISGVNPLVATASAFVIGALAGAITAAKFLQAFTHEHPSWAHLDIAGVAYADTDFAKTKAGTSFGVGLLLKFIENQL